MKSRQRNVASSASASSMTMPPEGNEENRKRVKQALDNRLQQRLKENGTS